MKIYSNKYYVLESIPGISGFKRWDEREYCIVTGRKARNERYSIVAEWTPQADERYEVTDGHLPGYRPVMDSAGVVAWLAANPFQAACPLGKARERLQARHHHNKVKTA